MTLLHEAVENKKFDIRIIEKNLSKGLITTTDFQKSVDQLPDDSENAAWVTIESLSDNKAGNEDKGASHEAAVVSSSAPSIQN